MSRIARQAAAWALSASAALAALITMPVHAGSTVGLFVGHEHLNNGSPNWHESAIRMSHEIAPRRLVDLSVTRTERFNLSDSQISAAYTAPLSRELTASIEANASPSHRVLARNAFGTMLQYEFAPAWLIHAGARTTRYDDVRVNQSLLMLEHYFSNFSWSVGWRPARAFHTTAHSGELRGSYYYGDRNSVGIILAGGKEAASIGGTVALTSLRSATLIGRHWLSRDWAFNYGIGSSRQGEFYVRNGVSIGVQHTF